MKTDFDNLKKENEVLITENKKNIEMICMLEETVKLLEKKLNYVETAHNNVETQTDEQDHMRCNECEYPAEDIYDLGEHLYKFHTSLLKR